MQSTANEILDRFPRPPGSVLKALEYLGLASCGDGDQELGVELIDLPRPWDPSTCPPELRAAIWEWCERVVVWVNHDYAWTTYQMIPECWPRHAHIARELPVLAFQRWAAEESISYEATEDWHRDSLPKFLERMEARLGSTCGRRGGGHPEEWPAAGAFYRFSMEDSVARRNAVFEADGAYCRDPLSP